MEEQWPFPQTYKGPRGKGGHQGSGQMACPFPYAVPQWTTTEPSFPELVFQADMVPASSSPGLWSGDRALVK